MEYAEAIREDMDDSGTDETAGVKALLKYDKELEKFPKATQQLLRWITKERKKDNHQEIIARLLDVRKRPEKYNLSDPEVRYFVDMEEALSQLKMNYLIQAQQLYEDLLVRYPKRAMIAFRLSDVYKLRNEYPKALEYARTAETLLKEKGSSKSEVEWITESLPLKKAYYLWRANDSKGAHAELSKAYRGLPKNASEDLRRKYFSSLIYYALEVAVSEKKIDQKELRGYIDEMKAFKMDSIVTALPEEVDTYGWACFHAGLAGEAQRAIREVLHCVSPKSLTSNTPVFLHKGNERPISLSDLGTFYEHVGLILA